MSIRSVQIHGILLVLLLVAAWLTIHGEDDPKPKLDDVGVTLVSAAEGEAEAVEYLSSERTLRIESKKDDRGRWFRGVETVTKTVKPPAPEPAEKDDGHGHGDDEHGSEQDDESAEDGADDAEPEVAETETEVFHAGRSAESLWEHLEPMKAVRVLENLTDEKRDELGLTETEDTLTVTVRGKAHVFKLGGKAYGTSDQYALTEDGRAVVLPRNLTSNLSQGARPFRERRLFDINRPDLAAVTYTAGERSLAIEQHEGAGPGQSFWARVGEEQGQTELKAAVDRLYAVQAESYVEETAGEAVLTVTVKNDEGEEDTLQVFRVAEPDGGESFLIRSGHSRLPAKVNPKRVTELLEVLADLY